VASVKKSTNPSTELTTPSVDVVVAAAGGKFMAVMLAARRARALGEYFANHVLPNEVPPQVPARSKHPLSIALDEVADGKIIPRPVSRAEFIAGKHAQAYLDSSTSAPPAPSMLGEVGHGVESV
jgi:DNA-directed RNA polymerase omega subunit